MRARSAPRGCSRSRRPNAWHFGLKSEIGADAHSGLVSSVIGTAANAAYASQAGALQHDDEQHAFGDASYRAEDRREEARGPRWHVAMQADKQRKLDFTRKLGAEAGAG